MGSMEGKTVVVTGTFNEYPRKQLIEVIESYGARVASAVSRKTDYLIFNRANGMRTGKYVAANNLNIRRVELKKWLELANKSKTTMITPFIDKLTKLPVTIKARAEELSRKLPMKDGVGWAYEDNYKGLGFSRGWFYDGAGNEDNVIIVDSGDSGDNTFVLLYTYDADSKLNTYGTNPPEEQIVFRGLPEALKEIVDGPSLKWDWDEIEPKITYATSSVWFDKKKNHWFYNEDAYSEETGGFGFASDIWVERTQEEWKEWLRAYLEG